ncbi:hypothetical protein MLD38_021726 [Melastoma candidum]|uniref:Uncharacterized protein n=1 Tax=Melastoma candidum TaxID=119954 RepID=A0ACB9QQ35_9MYRT|nr:hypothetical protein MLD38_021726 [Melastoma candidum]
MPVSEPSTESVKEISLKAGERDSSVHGAMLTQQFFNVPYWCEESNCSRKFKGEDRNSRRLMIDFSNSGFISLAPLMKKVELIKTKH